MFCFSETKCSLISNIGNIYKPKYDDVLQREVTMLIQIPIQRMPTSLKTMRMTKDQTMKAKVMMRMTQGKVRKMNLKPRRVTKQSSTFLSGRR